MPPESQIEFNEAKSTNSSGYIRRVAPIETDLIKEHLLRLDSESRTSRFGHFVSDDYIIRYTASVTDVGNLTFGYFIDGRIRALGELKRPIFYWSNTAEAAFSVEQPYSNMGIATELLSRIVRAARNRGIRHLMLHFSTTNPRMRALTSHFQAELQVEPEQITADILPPFANAKSIFEEMQDERIGFCQSMIDGQRHFLDLFDKPVSNSNESNSESNRTKNANH